MIERFRAIFIVLNLVSLQSIGYSQPVNTAKAEESQLPTRLHKYLRPYADAHDFSGVVLIANDERVLASASLGYANKDRKTLNDTETKFRIASLSKSFTGAAIAILSERGKLAFDDRLDKFFPGFPNGSNITIDMLLRHRSGVGSLDRPDDYRTCYTASQLVDKIGKLKPYFAPGTDDSYSNEGYNLLAAVIEKVSGLTYSEFLRANVFKPLGMNNSGSFCSIASLPKLANGYVAAAELGSLRMLPSPEVTQIGAGSAYSTAEDLLKWLRAIKHDRLFKISGLRYPYGWGKRDYEGHKLIEQSGMAEGYNSYIAAYQDDDLYFVFLSNVQTGMFNRVPRDLKAVYFGGDVSTVPSSVAFAEKNSYADLEGSYLTEGEQIPLNVLVKRDKLFIRWGSYPFSRSLTPISKDKFFHRAEYSTLTFERGSDEKVTAIVWQPDGGDTFVLKRLPKKQPHSNNY